MMLGWPDGLPLLAQPTITVTVFDMFTEQKLLSAKAEENTIAK